MERLEQMVRVEQGAALRMLAKANEAAEAGKATDARNFSVAHGVHFDKAAQLEQRVAGAAERRVRLAQAQAELLGEVIRFYLVEVLGLPLGGGARAALAGPLRQTGRGEPLTVPADVERARAELLDGLAGEIRERLPAVEPKWEERRPLGLPAPRDDVGAQERAGGERWLRPSGKVRALRERREAGRERRTNGSDEPDVVEGEVVSEGEGGSRPRQAGPRGGRRSRKWVDRGDGTLRRVE